MKQKESILSRFRFLINYKNVNGSNNKIVNISLGGSGVLVLALLLYIGWQALPKNEKMTGEFRVAVAGFSVVGKTSERDLGGQVGKIIADHLEGSQLKDFAKTMNLVAPYINVEVWDPKKVGKVGGESEEQRANEALVLAEKIDAHMIIYGVVDVSKPVWQIVPEFYINDQSFFDAEEMLSQPAMKGHYQFGAPIAVPGINSAARQMILAKEVSERAKVLSILTASLSYAFVHYYDDSIKILQTIEDNQFWKNDKGEDLEMKKVFYLLQGNAKSLNGDFEDAKMIYQKSLEIDGDYSRALVGMGNMEYIQALLPSQKSENYADIDVALLDQSLALFQQALRSEEKLPLADIEAKVHFGMGACLLAKVLAGAELYFDPAMGEFQAVIDEYGEGKNYRIKALAAESHARLGLIYNFSDDQEAAIKEYEQAVKLSDDNPERKTIFMESLERLKE